MPPNANTVAAEATDGAAPVNDPSSAQSVSSLDTAAQSSATGKSLGGSVASGDTQATSVTPSAATGAAGGAAPPAGGPLTAAVIPPPIDPTAAAAATVGMTSPTPVGHHFHHFHHPPPGSVASAPAAFAGGHHHHGHNHPQQQQHHPPTIHPTLPSVSQADRVAEARTALVASMANMYDSAMSSRAAELHANAAALRKQERDLDGATRGLRAETDKLEKVLSEFDAQVKEFGDVQNWAEVLERDFLVLEDVVRQLNGDTDEDSTSEGEEEDSRLGDAGRGDGFHGQDAGEGSSLAGGGAEAATEGPMPGPDSTGAPTTLAPEQQEVDKPPTVSANILAGSEATDAIPKELELSSSQAVALSSSSRAGKEGDGNYKLIPPPASTLDRDTKAFDALVGSNGPEKSDPQHFSKDYDRLSVQEAVSSDGKTQEHELNEGGSSTESTEGFQDEASHSIQQPLALSELNSEPLDHDNTTSWNGASGLSQASSPKQESTIDLQDAEPAVASSKQSTIVAMGSPSLSGTEVNSIDGVDGVLQEGGTAAAATTTTTTTTITTATA